MAYNRKDYYFHKAKTENFAARSVFKLEEIDQRFKLLAKGIKVLDLGAAPGSWSQYASQRIGSDGRILGIDLQSVRVSLPNAFFTQADMRTVDFVKLFEQSGITPPFQLVLSDMAPNTTGIKFTDQARSLELCELALSVALRFLEPGGDFVCKLFHGEAFEDFRKQLRGSFTKIEVLRPKSTRSASKEIFFVALGKTLRDVH